MKSFLCILLKFVLHAANNQFSDKFDNDAIVYIYCLAASAKTVTSVCIVYFRRPPPPDPYRDPLYAPPPVARPFRAPLHDIEIFLTDIKYK